MDPGDQRRPLSAAKAAAFLGVTAAGVALALWLVSFASNGAPDALSLVQRMRNGDSQFLLYVEVDGGYHGPGEYPLAAWPHPTLGARDGAANLPSGR